MELARRTAFLGGRTTSESWWGWRSMRRYLIIAVLFVAVVVLLVTMQSVWVALTIVVLVVVGLAAMRIAGEIGSESWGTNMSLALRSAVARVCGWDRFDPHVDAGLPFALGPDLELAGVTVDERGDELALLIDKDAIIGVFELDGTGGGIRRTIERNNEGERMGKLLRALADDNVPVDQIDIATRVEPAEPGPYERVARDGENRHPDLEAAVAQSFDVIRPQTDQARSWMVVRMNRAQLSDRAFEERRQADLATVAEIAFEVMGDVAAFTTERGFKVQAALTPPMLAGLLRSLWLPSYRSTDIRGVGETLRDTFPSFEPTLHHRALRVVDPTGRADAWYHAVGDVPIDGWPNAEVPMRFLEPIVVRGGSSRRLVVQQFRLISRRRAKPLALGVRVQAEAGRIHVRKQGQITAGDEEMRAKCTAMLVGDIAQRNATGVRTALRVVVSAPSERGVREARRDAESILSDDMGIQRWRWRDRDMARAMMTCLPLGRGMRMN